MGNIPGRPFTDTLGDLERGELLLTLTEKQYEIIQAVMETRKAGSLTLTVSYAPTGKGTVAVMSKVTGKVPEHDRATTSFFVDGEGGLHRNHPDQIDMPLRPVDMPANEPIRVGDND